MQKRENPWWNLLFNILLPIIILNKGGDHIGATNALVIAILFPLSYGLHELWQTKKINWISVLGLLNVAFTGGFALSGKTGIWFAFKEAAFPLLIGVFVWASSFTRKPALGIFLLNPQAFQIDKMLSTLDSDHKKKQFDLLVRKSTQYLSGSFLISAGLNFGLAYKIFTPLDLSKTKEIQDQLLNEQIAEMTKWSFIVILIPSMLILLALILYFGKRFKSITGESLENFFHQPANKN